MTRAPARSPRRLAPLLLSLALTPMVAGCDAKKKDPAPGGAEATPAAATPETAETAPEATPEVAGPATAELGAPAPAFTLADLDGKETSLASFAGKTVVLEWFNPECPFVKYAHGEGPLASMAAEQADKEVVWLAINSGAPGKQGHEVEVNRAAAATWNMAHPILRDPSGSVGRAYGAAKTPHMFIIDPEGVLRYAGALDNAPIGEPPGEEPYAGHFAAALELVLAGETPAAEQPPPYGCSVKYEG